MDKLRALFSFLRDLLPDLFIILGYLALTNGIYRRYGMAITLIAGGTILLLAGISSYIMRRN